MCFVQHTVHALCRFTICLYKTQRWNLEAVTCSYCTLCNGTTDMRRLHTRTAVPSLLFSLSLSLFVCAHAWAWVSDLQSEWVSNFAIFYVLSVFCLCWFCCIVVVVRVLLVRLLLTVGHHARCQQSGGAGEADTPTCGAGEVVGPASIKSAPWMNSTIVIFLDDLSKVEKVFWEWCRGEWFIYTCSPAGESSRENHDF